MRCFASVRCVRSQIVVAAMLACVEAALHGGRSKELPRCSRACGSMLRCSCGELPTTWYSAYDGPSAHCKLILARGPKTWNN